MSDFSLIKLATKISFTWCRTIFKIKLRIGVNEQIESLKKFYHNILKHKFFNGLNLEIMQRLFLSLWTNFNLIGFILIFIYLIVFFKFALN